MSASEFEIIHDHFERHGGANRHDVILGIGDDGAIVQPPADQQLVVAIDTLVEGVHFPIQTRAEDIGWKSLAVNLSDLAAMGAEPAWFTLALTLPESSNSWLKGFSAGLFELADQYGIQLVGGDTTRGPLAISIQVAGYVPAGKALRRTGAQAGDLIGVCGNIGDAMLGLSVLMDEPPLSEISTDRLVASLNRPRPRVREGLRLRDLAHSAIDVSDGLLSDLGHLLATARLGAELDYAALPFSAAGRQLLQEVPQHLPQLLDGGDDYALCFCLPPDRLATLQARFADEPDVLGIIGRVTETPGVHCQDAQGKRWVLQASGYEHFRQEDRWAY